MAGYSKDVMELFMNPQNIGEIENPSSIGKVGNPICGDLMWIYLKIDEETDVIEDIKVKTFGCVAAIATTSIMTELAKGKTVEDAEKLSNKDVADALEGLPPLKAHCSNLAADALHAAIEDYRNKKRKK